MDVVFVLIISILILIHAYKISISFCGIIIICNFLKLNTASRGTSLFEMPIFCEAFYHHNVLI